jgi:hypothetical protein
MPGFALPYDLIPSKDREFDPVSSASKPVASGAPRIPRLDQFHEAAQR